MVAGSQSELSIKKQNIRAFSLPRTGAGTATLAKITRPAFSAIFLRKRLFKLLEADGGHSATWISGPPGAGKTVLASSFMDGKSSPCLWCQLDSRDADPATFFYYMGQAVKRASPRSRPLPLLTPEYLPGLPAFTRNYFEELCGRFKPPFYIVFDNYHEVGPNSRFHEVIRDGIEAMPRNGRVIFISRAEPPKEFARMRANNSMKVIGWEELALRAEETEKIVRLKLKGHGPGDLAIKLHHMSGGWMAGLALMIEKAKKEAFNPVQIRAIAEDTIFEYFSSEIFEKLDTENENFLIMTSMLPVMDAETARRLTGIEDAGQILRHLYLNNQFVERRFHTDHVYQYHPLFREFLLHAAKERLAGDLPALKEKAALILYEAGRYEDAFELFRDGKRWEWIERLVMENSQSLVAQGRCGVLEDWITCLPADILAGRPWLEYNLGICRMPFNQAESRMHLERALRLFEERKDPAGVFLCWSGIADSCVFGLDNLKLLDEWIPRLGALMRSFGGFPSGQIEARVANSMFMALIYRQPQHPETEAWGERAIQSSRMSGDERLKVLALSNFAFHKLNSGRLEEAAAAIDSFKRSMRSVGMPPLTVITMKWVEVMYYTYTAGNKECQRAVSSGLKLAASSGAYIMNFLLLGQGALSALDAGDLGAANKLIGEIDYFSGRDPLTGKGYYRFLLAYNAMLRKDFQLAVAYVEIALRQALATGFPLATSYCHIEYSHILHELKEHEKALHHLGKAHEIAKQIKYRYMEFICLLTKAHFAFDNGKEKSGLDSLRRGMAIGRECGFMNTYTLLPDVVSALFSKALEAGIETDYAKALISKRNLSPEAPSMDVGDWPWPIKIYTLGRFGILKDGKPLVASRKVQQRPLGLLKALIALGGEGVRKETLADTLWPEAEGDLQLKAFAIALHRLRNILGDENAVRLSGGRVTLDPRRCWVDARAFESMLEKAGYALRNGDGKEVAHLLEKAAALYCGPFLPDEGKPVIKSYRERLQAEFSGLSKS